MNAELKPQARLSAPGMAPILAILHEAAGMDFTSEGRVSVLTNRVEERIAALGLSSGREYLDLLAGDAAEIARLIEAVAVNETFFFRHPDQFDFLRRVVLPAKVAEARKQARPGQARLGSADASGARPIRIWSAGCSNGCEPYSLAIACREAESWIGPFAWEVIASDIDTHAVDDARRAVFSEREVSQEMSADLRSRYFRAPDNRDNRWALIDSIRDRVTFQRMNLVRHVLPPECDIIFCRNVLYYFSDAVRNNVLRRIWRTCRPGASFFIGPMESATGLEAFFRVVDLDARALVAWTTERRASEVEWRFTTRVDAPASGAPVIERRGRSAPLCGVAGNGTVLQLAGAVASMQDLAAFGRKVALEAGKLDREVHLDLRDLTWISNEALHELKLVLEAARRGGLPIRSAVFRDRETRDWFVTAGFGAIIPRFTMEQARLGQARLGEDEKALSVQRSTFSVQTPVPETAPRPGKLFPGAPVPRAPVPETLTFLHPGSLVPGAPASPVPMAALPAVVKIEVPSCVDDDAGPTVPRARVPGATELRASITRALTSGAGEIQIDLSACRYLDDHLLTVLARAFRARSDSQRIVFIGASTAVARALGRHLPPDAMRAGLGIESVS